MHSEHNIFIMLHFYTIKEINKTFMAFWAWVVQMHGDISRWLCMFAVINICD